MCRKGADRLPFYGLEFFEVVEGVVGLTAAAVREEGVAVEVQGFGSGELEGEEGFGEAGVVGCGGDSVVRVGDAGAIGGKDDFAPGTVGGMAFAVGFDVEFGAACGGDDDFGDASGAAVAVDPGANKVGGCGGGRKGCESGDRGDQGGEGWF
jgi:hypothetical protein